MLDLLPVLRVLGILLMVFALTMGLPLGVSWVQAMVSGACTLCPWQ